MWEAKKSPFLFLLFRQKGFSKYKEHFFLALGALGGPRGMEWGGRREEGSGWGTHVNLWRIHFDIWQI